jgi:hypothetical protein
MTLHTFKVGDRVRLKQDAERYPLFIAPLGMVGTVHHVERTFVDVKMDEKVPGAYTDFWDNCIQFSDDDLDNLNDLLERI